MVLVLYEFSLNFKSWHLRKAKYLKEGGREKECVDKWRKERKKKERGKVAKERKRKLTTEGLM